ncbi:DUF4197 domain-containing protein [Thioalkalivibrio sp. HL-Eb18]|uniref:DUF4197 domain-containing protein n=1 Tax=Thioalkalivibrio sp. HL-Eb18 TaxID=1266913 RepID=UPI000370A477|nr:DUF4197 domain-containing protein [Thioalkalivibrio sp. HL-Eb18]
MPERMPRLSRRRLLALMLAPGLMAIAAAPTARASWWPFNPDVLRALTRRPDASDLTTAEIIEAVHEALIIASHSATETLSQRNGFFGNPDVRIPLPEVLATARRSLDRIGMATPLNQLEEGMNRAAEAAIPEAREPLVRAVFALDLDNAREILVGDDDAATRHLEYHARVGITEAMRPAIQQSLEQVQALDTYGELKERMREIPFLARVRFDPVEHVLEHAMDGLFFMLAEEEARLRANPQGRGTDVLHRVFRRQ